MEAKARKYGLIVYPSSLKDKKYMIFHNGKRVHFGQQGYDDYTMHHNEKRREAFRRRNHRWAKAPMYSPAWLSYHLAW
jgi:hypothetical protein